MVSPYPFGLSNLICVCANEAGSWRAAFLMMDTAGSSLAELSLSLSSELILNVPGNRQLLQSPLPVEIVAAARSCCALEWGDKSHQKWHPQALETVPFPPLCIRVPFSFCRNLGSF